MRHQKHSEATKAKMSETRKGRVYTPEHRAAIGEGIRRAAALRGPSPTKAALMERRRLKTEAMNAQFAAAADRLREVLPPRITADLAVAPTAEELGSTPARCNFYRWMKAQADHDTVVGRLLAVLPWRFEGETSVGFRLALAARQAPELDISEDIAKLAAEATLEQWRAFKGVPHA
jgi:hypothetical protein